MATPEWSAGRKQSFIISVLRSGTRRYPPKYTTLNEAKTEKKINKKTGRLAQHFLCALCEKEYVAKEVQVDHIEPVVKDKFIDWNTYIPRLFCEQENLQCLCITCHKKKTTNEKTTRNLKKETNKSKVKSALPAKKTKK